MKGNNKHIDFEAFRRYRADEMTPEERNAFERELQKDIEKLAALEEDLSNALVSTGGFGCLLCKLIGRQNHTRTREI